MKNHLQSLAAPWAPGRHLQVFRLPQRAAHRLTAAAPPAVVHPACREHLCASLPATATAASRVQLRRVRGSQQPAGLEPAARACQGVSDLRISAASPLAAIMEQKQHRWTAKVRQLSAGWLQRPALPPGHQPRMPSQHSHAERQQQPSQAVRTATLTLAPHRFPAAAAAAAGGRAAARSSPHSR